MALAPHATRDDLLGVDAPSPLSAEHVQVVMGWSENETERVLTRASGLVDDYTGRVMYEVDAQGNATDGTIAVALRDATIGVVELWLEVGEENDVDGLAADQISVQGFSGHRAPEVSRRVLRPLRRAGLLAQPGVER